MTSFKSFAIFLLTNHIIEAGAFAPHMQLKPVDFLSKALVEQKSKGILVTILEGMLRLVESLLILTTFFECLTK